MQKEKKMFSNILDTIGIIYREYDSTWYNWIYELLRALELCCISFK